MNQPPAYEKLPAYYFGVPIRPMPTFAVGDVRKVRVYQDGFDAERSEYVCASYERARTMTSQVLMTFCVAARGAS